MVLDDLTRSELIDLIQEYDKYVLSFDEELQTLDRIPVCINEFYDNEFQEIKEKNRTVFEKMTEEEVEEVKDIIDEFNNVDEAFDYIYGDDDTSKEDLIELMPYECKEEMVLDHENVRKRGDKYYYSCEIYSIEDGYAAKIKNDEEEDCL